MPIVLADVEAETGFTPGAPGGKLGTSRVHRDEARYLPISLDTDGSEAFDDNRCDNQQAPARGGDPSDEEAQELVCGIGDTAAALQSSLHQRVALGSIERQDPIPDPAACGLGDEAPDAA